MKLKVRYAVGGHAAPLFHMNFLYNLPSEYFLAVVNKLKSSTKMQISV